jgi:hypothetical protein
MGWQKHKLHVQLRCTVLVARGQQPTVSAEDAYRNTAGNMMLRRTHYADAAAAPCPRVITPQCIIEAVAV